MIGYAIIVSALLFIETVNVLNTLHDRARLDQPLAWWKAAVWEGSSGLALAALAWIPMMMVLRFPPERPPWLRNLPAHVTATIPFSLLHVGLMIALREAAYALAGEDYRFASVAGELLYEYRKDFLSYTIFAAIFWIIHRLRRSAEDGHSSSAPNVFDIDEGSRLIRVAAADILCARSAGNYVEFFLADGRRPLMRTTLSRVETLLAPSGFVRTHKSWLANPAHVVEAAAEGSGDYGLRLSDGTDVPLSRRYPAALGPLRLNRAN